MSNRINEGIPFTAHGAQIPLPLIIFGFYPYFRLGYVYPAGLGKSFSWGPAGLEPPALARMRKKEKS